MRMYARFSIQIVQRSGSRSRDQSSPVTGAWRGELDVQHAAQRVHSRASAVMLGSMRIACMIALSALGCTAHAPRPAAVIDLDRRAITAWTEEDMRPATIVLRDPRGITEPVRITPRERSPVPLGPRISARFHRAPLESALRFLAEASDLGIVIGEGIDGHVSADLRDVRSVAAMQAVAEAHGVELSFVGRTVIARRM